LLIGFRYIVMTLFRYLSIVGVILGCHVAKLQNVFQKAAAFMSENVSLQ